MNINILLNNNLKFNLLKKNNKQHLYLLIFNNNSCVKFLISKKCNIFFLKNLNYLILKTNFFKRFENIDNIINSINTSLNFYFSKKIIFSGKGYKIKKSSKNFYSKLYKFFIFYFNKSHFNILYFFSVKIKKLKKTKILLYNVNYQYLTNICKTIINIRPFNPFTLKGLRLSRQIIYKKIGKKSS